MTSILTGIFASQISGHLYSKSSGEFDALGTVTVPSGGVSSITFAAIPQEYKHLQLRTFSASATPGDPIVRLNGDTGSNYYGNLMYGTGAGTPANYFPGVSTGLPWAIGNNPSVANAFGIAILDLLDYSSTTKQKPARSFFGYDNNGSGQINYSHGLWTNTNAITSLTVVPNTGNLSQYSSYALYGVK
jgi:hypothetical protein